VVSKQRTISVRISEDAYKQLRNIAHRLNEDFSLVGKEAATIDDVISGLLFGFDLDEKNASKAPLARVGSLVIKRTVKK